MTEQITHTRELPIIQPNEASARDEKFNKDWLDPSGYEIQEDRYGEPTRFAEPNLVDPAKLEAMQRRDKYIGRVVSGLAIAGTVGGGVGVAAIINSHPDVSPQSNTQEYQAPEPTPGSIAAQVKKSLEPTRSVAPQTNEYDAPARHQTIEAPRPTATSEVTQPPTTTQAPETTKPQPTEETNPPETEPSEPTQTHEVPTEPEQTTPNEPTAPETEAPAEAPVQQENVEQPDGGNKPPPPSAEAGNN